MSWLDDRTTVCIYRHPDGTEEYWEGRFEDRPETLDGAVYVGFTPDKLNSTIRIRFDNNGRIGYRYNLGNGKVAIRSATRERYEHMAGNTPASQAKAKSEDMGKSVYTKEYQRAVDTQTKLETAKRKAKFNAN
mgnify:CR=1 FL=1